MLLARACLNHGVIRRNIRIWWQERLARKVSCDREKDAQLDNMGGIVVHIWQHENPIRGGERN